MLSSSEESLVSDIFWGGFLAIVWTGQWRETIGEDDREGLWAPVVTEATSGKKTKDKMGLFQAL